MEGLVFCKQTLPLDMYTYKSIMHTSSYTVYIQTFRWIYYTTIGPGRGMIAKISMDGTERMTLHDNSVVIYPNAITLDYTTDTLYWVDASNRHNIVGKSKTDLGSPNMTVFTFRTERTPFHATYHEGELYITGWRATSVSKLELDSTPELSDLVPMRGRTGMIRVVADSKQQPGESFATLCNLDRDSICTAFMLCVD